MDIEKSYDSVFRYPEQLRLRISIEEYWQRDLPLTMPREIEPILKNDLINDIIGPRRAGKTYLMFLAIKKGSSLFHVDNQNPDNPIRR
ncbi:MAG: ATP-binding protein [Methanosarcinales archaeon]|nr:MAG: ATP-binding protein [Methanosarcinales archaeon]